MNISNLLVTSIVTLFICAGLLIRYIYAWRIDIRNTQTKIDQIEKKIAGHTKECPARQRLEEQLHPLPVLSEKANLDNTEMIRQHILLFHPNLISTLERYCQEKLTYSEEMLCMMIKLEYNNKEIASMLSITPSSVITARYRLKRKLSLAQEQVLDGWIQTIDKNPPLHETSRM